MKKRRPTGPASAQMSYTNLRYSTDDGRRAAVDEVVRQAPPLRISKDDPRLVVKLAWNGPVKVEALPVEFPFTGHEA